MNTCGGNAPMDCIVACLRGSHSLVWVAPKFATVLRCGACRSRVGSAPARRLPLRQPATGGLVKSRTITVLILPCGYDPVKIWWPQNQTKKNGCVTVCPWPWITTLHEPILPHERPMPGSRPSPTQEEPMQAPCPLHTLARPLASRPAHLPPPPPWARQPGHTGLRGPPREAPAALASVARRERDGLPG